MEYCSCNNQQLCGLKTWSRCGDSTYCRVPSSAYVCARLLFSHGHSFTTRLNRVNNESPYFVAPTWSITGSPGRKRRRQTYIQYSNLHTTYRMNSYILSVKKKFKRCIHGLVCYALGSVSRDAWLVFGYRSWLGLGEPPLGLTWREAWFGLESHH